MSVRKIGNVWYFDFQFEGVRYRRRAGLTKKAAEDAETEARNRVMLGAKYCPDVSQKAKHEKNPMIEIEKSRNRIQKRKERVEYVYFIRSGPCGPIKIGSTCNVKSRMKSLQTSCPYQCRILSVVLGDIRTEKFLHMCYSHLRTHGEWFIPDTKLIDLVLWSIDTAIEKEKTQYTIDKHHKDWMAKTHCGGSIEKMKELLRDAEKNMKSAIAVASGIANPLKTS